MRLVVWALLCSLAAAGATWSLLSDPYVEVTVKGRRFSSRDGSLRPVEKLNVSGSDALGRFSGLATVWAVGQVAVLETALVTYPGDAPDVQRYFSRFLVNISSKSTEMDSDPLQTAWPAFAKSKRNLIYFCFQDNFGYPRLSNLSDASNYAPYGGQPSLIFDRDLRAIIFSPVNYFFVSGMGAKKNGGFSAGLLSSFLEISVNLQFDVIAISGSGINDTFSRWGQVVQILSSAEKKTAEKKKRSDLENQYLTYYTDHGSYYWYNSPGKNYDNLMVLLGKSFSGMDLPVRGIQLDSWWYQKGDTGFDSGGSGSFGTYSWTAGKEIFSNGLSSALASFSKQLRRKLMVAIFHNRWFAPVNVYTNQWPFYSAEKEMVLPQSADFYSALIRDLNVSDIASHIVYEQDWLITQYKHINALRNSSEMGAKWFSDMNSGIVSQKNASIQLCMSLPLHYLQGASLSSMATIRVSDDFIPNLDFSSTQQWRIGYNSLFASSLGYLPFKDVFWSSDGQQMGCRNYDTCSSNNGELQSLIAVLSCGPVAFGDSVDHINATRLMRTCNSEGLILQPDLPARTIDGAFLKVPKTVPPAGQFFQTELVEIWSSFATLGNQRFFYILAVNLTEDFALNLQRDLGTIQPLIIFDLRSHSVVGELSMSNDFVIQKNALFNTPKIPFSYLMAVPALMSGFVLLGELEKYVPISRRRMSDLIETDLQFSVTIAAEIEEQVELSVLDQVRGNLQRVKCIENATLICSRANGKCKCE